MRVLMIMLAFSMMGLSACSLQLPGGPVADEPFFASTYED